MGTLTRFCGIGASAAIMAAATACSRDASGAAKGLSDSDLSDEIASRIEVREDPTIFTLFMMLNAAGYDEERGRRDASGPACHSRRPPAAAPGSGLRARRGVLQGTLCERRPSNLRRRSDGDIGPAGVHADRRLDERPLEESRIPRARGPPGRTPRISARVPRRFRVPRAFARVPHVHRRLHGRGTSRSRRRPPVLPRA